MNLKKVLSIVLALAFLVAFGLTGAAQANIIWNGNFDNTSVGWPNGSASGAIMGGVTMDGQNGLGPGLSGGSSVKASFQYDDMAFLNDGAQNTTTNQLLGMPENINGSANPNWVAGAPSETVNFSYQYDIKTGATSASVQLWYWAGAGAPPYISGQNARNFSPANQAGWTKLYDSGALGTTTGWATYNGTLLIPGLDPEYFGVVLNANGNNYIGFDNIQLDDVQAVPIPPSALLLGTGLLGLVALRPWRKKKSLVS